MRKNKRSCSPYSLYPMVDQLSDVEIGFVDARALHLRTQTLQQGHDLGALLPIAIQ